MRNLKAKFVQEVNLEIEDLKEGIKRMQDSLKLIPEQIVVTEKHIEELRGLLKSIQNDTSFTMSELTYGDGSDDEEYF